MLCWLSRQGRTFSFVRSCERCYAVVCLLGNNCPFEQHIAPRCLGQHNLHLLPAAGSSRQFCSRMFSAGHYRITGADAV